ncbi:MAG TPA: PDZ domain-containing protein [Tepidisphaeraceae bacterium]|nr:PDZ domain-containing protein [Tepidisphaeraceae bacterium]
MKPSRWICLLMLLCAGRLAIADPTPADSPQEFYDRVRPAMVAVKYEWNSELGKQDIIGAGVVVRKDGLVMMQMLLVSPVIPDAQMKNFKIIVPSDTQDYKEVDATFLGRDERTDLGFVQAKEPGKWTPIHFEDEPLTVGEKLYGLGVLPEDGGYKAYFTEAVMAAQLRGEIPLVLTTGALGDVGSPVFDGAGHAVGIVQPQEGADPLLDPRASVSSVTTPPHFFTPTRFFQASIDDPPTVDHPLVIPWTGLMQLTGVNKQLAEFLGLTNKPAAQIGDVAPGSPAAKAGMQPGTIILAVNGQPLTRGDLPEEIPLILHRQIMRMKVGQKVTFTVMSEKDKPTQDIELTLEARPLQPNQAKRYYAEDLGFVVRQPVFVDAYVHKLKQGAGGVVVDLVRRDGAAASAKLNRDDWVLQLNGQPVTDLDHFQQDLESLRKSQPHQEVVMVVLDRTGRQETINIEPPQSDSGVGMP